MLSVVIPTLQQSQHLGELLQLLQRSDVVGEVVVVNNADRPLPHRTAKTTVLDPGRNLFVNPSWNLGVRHCRHRNLLICNDDVLFDAGVLDFADHALTAGSGAIGPDRSCFREELEGAGPDQPELVPTDRRTWGWGTMMFMPRRHYVPVPEDLLIWAGDDWVFRHQRRQNHLLRGVTIQTVMGSTSRQARFSEQKNADLVRFREAHAENPYLHRREAGARRAALVERARVAARWRARRARRLLRERLGARR